MIKSILQFIYIWITISFFGIVCVIPFLFIVPLGSKKIFKGYVTYATGIWSKHMLWFLGIKTKIHGFENIPKHDNICIVSNHQTSLDFVLIIAMIPKIIGFIAKVELLWIPFVNIWMYALHCVFINRSKKEKAVRIIKKRIEHINDGFPMLIFPEGTRSNGREMNKFKVRGLQTIIETNTILLPITIVNSYECLNGVKLTKGTIDFVIHPVIDSAAYSKEEKKQLVYEIEKIIAQPLN